MKNYVKKLENLVPRYGLIMIVCALAINMVAYYGSRLMIGGCVKHDLTIALDTMIPFRTEWIIVYVLAYIQWATGFIVTGRERKGICYRVLGGEIIAKIICLICFVLLPVTIQRPEVVGDAPWDHLTRLIYAVDTPDALFPSIHCLESYIFFRGAMMSEKMPRWYTWVMGIFTLLVFASTVFVKQHFVMDVIAGVVVGEIGLQAVRLFLTKKEYYGTKR